MLVRRLVSALLSPVLAAGIRDDYAQASAGRKSEITIGNAIGGSSIPTGVIEYVRVVNSLLAIPFAFSTGLTRVEIVP